MNLQKRIEPALDLEMNESALAKAPSEEIDIKSRILTVRGVQVMIDRDLAQLYGVDVKRLNEQVKRNAERFPSDFMFQLSKEECPPASSQCNTRCVALCRRCFLA